MKKSLCLLLVAALLQSCGLAAAPQPKPAPPLTLHLALSASADTICQQTAQTFAQQVAVNSQQRMTIELVQAAQPADALDDGSCQLALVPSGQVAALVPGLDIIAQPFFWKDYTHFTTALNQPENLEMASLLTRQALGAQVMGVYYNRTVTLLARKRVYDELALENLSIALAYDSKSYDCFTALGARVQQLSNQEAVGAFMRGEIILTEGSIAQLPDFLTGQNTVHLLPLNHYILGDWLLLSEEANQTLTPEQQAILGDAMAVTMEQNDRTRQEWEADTVQSRAADGVVQHEGSFPITRAAGNRYLFEQVVPNSDWSPQLIEAYLMGNRPGRY